MKKSLQNKLKKYGTMAAAVTGVVAATDADAQIVYTDLTPDSIFSTSGDSYNLDLDGDGTVDFTINLTTSTNIVSIVNTGSNQNMGSGAAGNGWNYPNALSSLSAIGSAGPWQNGAVNASALFSYFSSGSTYGNWGGAQDKFLGLEFDISGATHYGWARLDVAADGSSFTIKDYAYESTAGVSIDAGEMPVVSISEFSDIENVKVFISNNQLNLNIASEYVGYQFKLVDMLGRDVINEKISNTSSKMNVSNFPKGVYIVLIEGGEKAYAKKIMIK